MNAEFARTLSLLRQEKKVSQRTVAGALGISQALLSHYENGIREPGLQFVINACDYYSVSADFLLGRSLSRDGATINPEELYDMTQEKDNSIRGSVLAKLSKKLVVNSVGLLFDLLGKTGNRDAIRAASDYLSTAVAQLFRRLHTVTPGTNPDFFSVSQCRFEAGVGDAEMKCSEVALVEALQNHAKDKGAFPALGHEDLARDYPALYQSLLQVLHSSGTRLNNTMDARQEK